MNNKQIRKVQNVTERIFADVEEEGLENHIKALCLTLVSILGDTRVGYCGNNDCIHQGQRGECEIKMIYLDDKGKCRFYRRGKKIPNLVI